MRRALLINVAYFALIIGAFYLFMRYAFWTLSPFIFAFFIAMLLQKPVCAVTKRTPLKKPFVAFAAVMFITLLFLGLLTLAGTSIFKELKDLATTLTTTFESIPDFIGQTEAWILNLIRPLPDSIESSVATSVSNFANNLLTAYYYNDFSFLSSGKSGGLMNLDLSFLMAPISGVISTASKLPSLLVSVIIFFISRLPRLLVMIPTT